MEIEFSLPEEEAWAVMVMKRLKRIGKWL